MVEITRRHEHVRSGFYTRQIVQYDTANIGLLIQVRLGAEE